MVDKNYVVVSFGPDDYEVHAAASWDGDANGEKGRLRIYDEEGEMVGEVMPGTYRSVRHPMQPSKELREAVSVARRSKQ